MVAECPCHEAEGDLLSVHPVGAGVGRVVLRPIFDESPEGCGVFFILGGGIGADEGVDKGEAVGFPDEFDIGGGVVGELGPVFVYVTLNERSLRVKSLGLREERSFAAIAAQDDMAEIIFMPIRRKVCFYKFVGEVFYFAVEEAIGFIDGDLFIPWDVFW